MGGRWDPAFYQAAREFAKATPKEPGQQVSGEKVIMTLALRSSHPMRLAFRKRYKEIKREMQRNENTTNKTSSKDDQ